MRVHYLVLGLAASLLAACSGGGGGSGGGPSFVSPPATGGGGSTQSNSKAMAEDAVTTTNGVGTPLKNFASYDETISSTSYSASEARVAVDASPAKASGTCRNGVEFFAPDTAGDANSTETKLFYDAACTQLARDAVRVFTSTGATSETLTRAVSLYAAGNATPIAMRSESETIANATFDQYGFPIVADGFTRSGTSSLTISGSKTIDAGAELIVEAASNATNTFCDDTAGYNATGNASLNETFGWAGGVLSGGTRTVNSDGSVTWAATHAGTAYKGPIGSLALATGSLNTACPIATPAFTLTGGTANGAYSIPIVATYHAGMLVSLSITNATLTNGDALSVSTTPGANFGDSNFVVGTISNGATQIASFSVNGFGDGALTITQTGAQYVITDWHVVK